MLVTTENTYEGAYYLLHKGKMISFSERKLPKNKIKKNVSIYYKWQMTFEVDEKHITNVKNHTAQANIHDIAEYRYKLKKKIERIILC